MPPTHDPEQEVHDPEPLPTEAPTAAVGDRPWSADLRSPHVDDTVSGEIVAEDSSGAPPAVGAPPDVQRAPAPSDDSIFLDEEDDDDRAAAPAPGRARPARRTDAPAVPGAARRNEETHGVSASEQDPAFPQVPGLRLERLVTQGPCGRLYDARDVATRRPVQVRILPGALQRTEARRLDSLLLARHPNLFCVLRFAVCRDGPFLVVEREEGETARAWIRRIGPLPERIALSVVLEAARGLRHAEFHGAVHGDLSPDAVMIDRAGQVRVRGVGMRKLVVAQGDAPMAPDYAAPERRAGEPPTFQGDLWSLGAVLHFLLTGAPPDPDESAARSLESRRTEVSASTTELLARLLAADPDARPGTWDLLLVELERLVPSAAPAAEPAPLAVDHKRRILWIAAATVALVTLAVLLRSAVS